MTDDAKALVERLRDMADEYDSGHYESWPTTDAFNQAADRIEAQAAEIERLKGAWEDEARRYAGNAEYWQTETERLREAGNDLGFYAGHEDACDCVKGWAKGPCNCGYTEAWQAWRAALGETE